MIGSPDSLLTPADLFANPALRSYLSNLRDWHGYIRFLGLPDRRDHPDIIVDRLFVAPLLTDRYVSPDEEPSEWSEQAETLKTALSVDKPMVLLGDPGTGKSALVNYLVWLLARPSENGLVAGIGWHLPIPMVLRELRLDGVKDFDGLLQAFLGHAMSEPLRDGKLLHEALSSGQGFILLDGIDEISDIEARKRLRQAVIDGMNRYPSCRWLLTSRIVGYEDVPFGLYRMSDRDRALDAESGRKMDGMSDLFIKRSAAGFLPDVATRYIAPFDDRRIKDFARRWYEVREAAPARAGKDAAHLVEAVHGDDGILRLGRIPHLLTMMALIHRVEATLPQERALLYDRIAEAYLESIDKFRGIYSGAADLPFKKRWLARVGYEMQRLRDGQVTLDQSEVLVDAADILKWVQEEMKRHPASGLDDPEDFLLFVKRRSGLLLPRGEDRYAFIHLSFQEYFAAYTLKREITTPTWVRHGKSSLGFDSESLAEWARIDTWIETFVFLFELLCPEEDWHDDLRDRVFGKGFSFLCDNHESVMDLNFLLSRVASSRRSCLEATDILDTICRQDDRKSILYLSFNWLPVLNLAPIEHLSSLQWLSLNGTRVSDLTPIEHLSSLQWLSLNGTRVSDLTPIEHLSSLRSLSLAGTQVYDLTPLKHLSSLQSLSLEYTQVSDLAPLEGIRSLRSLWLIGTHVSDLTPLSGRPSLQVLFLDETPVSDLAPLAGVPSLQVLSMYRAAVSDLAPLGGLSSLQVLFLSGTAVSDLTPLGGLSSLRVLHLDGTRVFDLEPLFGLKSLRYLYISLIRASDAELCELRGALPDCKIVR